MQSGLSPAFGTGVWPWVWQVVEQNGARTKLDLDSLAFAIHGTESCSAPVVAVSSVQSHRANSAGALGRQIRGVGLE